MDARACRCVAQTERERLVGTLSISGHGGKLHSLANVNKFVAEGRQHGRGVGTNIGRLRRGCGHREKVHGAIRETTLADIGCLRSKGERINGRAISGEQSDGFAIFAQREIHMQLRPVGAVGSAAVVGPDQEVTFGQD